MNDIQSFMELTAKIQYRINANDKKAKRFGTAHLLYQSEIHFIESIGLSGGYCASELSKKLGITNGAVTQVADKLLKKKLIRKYKKAENKKTVYITLTKEGVRAYKNHEKFHKDFNKKLTAYLSSLSKKEFSAIARLAELVNENIPDFDKTEDIV
ncbi:MarR family transcriptional regulator [Treponema sp. Marseille-Q4523]|uniref:MarR family transcriptional regulator n=1 Tax=Treponema sp. Marseille-Q4523 TaxID=2810610 RepID=UPI0019611C36|nr:MarR family transcriptional regulator [Treponema sp. Marseille-Q4523]MBM7022162.1 MarR family transcriptional regulator [Treponema sp. Marseille-Q4523]